MLRRIDTLYKEKPTLAELYAKDAQLFSGLGSYLPTDSDRSIGLSDFVALALTELGELQTIFPTAATLKAFLTTWGKLHAANWAKMQTALDATYNPLHNYDRTETVSDVESVSGSGSSSGSSSEAETSDREEYGSGFNSATTGAAAVPVRREQTSPRRQASETSEAESTTSRSLLHESNIAGNIGVTTSQQMLEAELQLRDRFSLYYIILDEFRREICVEVW